jgi:hypothetical protein
MVNLAMTTDGSVAIRHGCCTAMNLKRRKSGGSIESGNPLMGLVSNGIVDRNNTNVIGTLATGSGIKKLSFHSGKGAKKKNIKFIV